VAAAEQRLRVARADRFPVVSASASAGRSAYRSEYAALGELNPLDQSVGFGLTVSIPVFRQFRTSYTIEQARVQLELAREELRAERLAAERELRVALLDLKNAIAAAALAERAAELSRDRLELAREQFRLGSIPFTELQTILDRAAQAERDALNARFDLAEAQITLREKAAGALPILDP
jgi:outer membrane protein